MIGKLFYLCPSCLAEDSLHHARDEIRCLKCQKIYPFINNHISYKANNFSVPDFYELIRSSLPLSRNQSGHFLRTSKDAILRQGIKQISYVGRNNLHSIIESPVEVDSGRLELAENKLIFRGNTKVWEFQQKNITGYTTNSKYFEFKVKGEPFFQILFENESPLKYEDLFTKWFQQDEQKDHFLEHQPKIIYKIPRSPFLILKRGEIKNDSARERYSVTEFLLHLFVGLPIVYFLKWHANLSLLNLHLVPQKGPFILLMNHESYLDPIIASTILSRRIAFFTKSTSFADRLLQPIFRAYRSLPNRRYETDPQVVREALSVLKEGNCIGIFPEGERSWNGKLLPFKYSTVKFLMSVQVPIVIMSITGAYDVLPRWTHKILPGQIKIEVQNCFSLLPERWTVADLKKDLESYFLEI
jgi:1-acyl-sn-glycerol-3-phosphate acyltransferase